mmetsp:Transcript_19021/g.39628  ORF Transcript_19021/g.39628 Transcript_19021/m.39628 type:complete len:248 (-) Transcript_19021:928-1671(-)
MLGTSSCMAFSSESTLLHGFRLSAFLLLRRGLPRRRLLLRGLDLRQLRRLRDEADLCQEQCADLREVLQVHDLHDSRFLAQQLEHGLVPVWELEREPGLADGRDDLSHRHHSIAISIEASKQHRNLVLVELCHFERVEVHRNGIEAHVAQEASVRVDDAEGECQEQECRVGEDDGSGCAKPCHVWIPLGHTCWADHKQIDGNTRVVEGEEPARKAVQLNANACRERVCDSGADGRFEEREDYEQSLV